MVIPIHDVNPTRRTAWVTYALIAINVVVFLLSPEVRLSGAENPTAAQVCQEQAFYDRYAAIPDEMVGNDPQDQVATGEDVVTRTGQIGCVVDAPTYHKSPILSVLYAMFLHGGWLHLLGNMLFLWIFGNNVEERLGRLRFLLFYLIAGYVAAYGFALANAGSDQPLIGASGAIAGVLGAYIVLWPKARVWTLVSIIPLKLPAWLVLGFWFALQWAYSAGYGVQGGVAYLAHVVGFVFGALVGLFFRRSAPPPAAYPPSGYPPGVYPPGTYPPPY